MSQSSAVTILFFNKRLILILGGQSPIRFNFDLDFPTDDRLLWLCRPRRQHWRV